MQNFLHLFMKFYGICQNSVPIAGDKIVGFSRARTALFPQYITPARAEPSYLHAIT
jgi:hypothetical protein